MSKFTKRATIKGLVITRKEGDQILVNHGEIRIEVVEVKGKCVRLAFQAAKDVTIHRAEASAEKDSDNSSGA
jgi:carbon storage regulator CsrA